MLCPTHMAVLIKLESVILLRLIHFSAILKTRHLTIGGQKVSGSPFFSLVLSQVENSCIFIDFRVKTTCSTCFMHFSFSRENIVSFSL